MFVFQFSKWTLKSVSFSFICFAKTVLTFGLTGNAFKERYRNWNRDFKQKYENSTELVKYTWQLKRDNISFL